MSRFGDSAVIGRRILEDDLVEKAERNRRNYDTHDDRQRRTGVLIGGTGLGGAGLVVSGVRGIRRDTLKRSARSKNATGALVHRVPSAKILGGAALLGVAGDLQRRSISTRNRRWE